MQCQQVLRRMVWGHAANVDHMVLVHNECMKRVQSPSPPPTLAQLLHVAGSDTHRGLAPRWQAPAHQHDASQPSMANNGHSFFMELCAVPDLDSAMFRALLRPACTPRLLPACCSPAALLTSGA